MSETSVDPDRRLGDLVEETPAFARAFESLGIDYCCGGDRSLAETCREEGLDVAEVRERLADAEHEGGDERREWESMTELVEHIVATHHQHLREELPELEDLVWTVRNAHEGAHPELREVELEFTALATEMRSHTDEEETEVFPIVEKLDRGERLDDAEVERLRAALRDLEADHEETAGHLDRIAELTDDYAVPEDACPKYRSMLDRLEALERDTHLHVHRENNVLFEAAESELQAQLGTGRRRNRTR